MKTLKKVVWVLLIAIVVILSVYGFYGGFTKITPDIAKEGGETLVYEKITGDYRQSSTVSDKVYHSLLRDYNIETTKGFGIYYDNPKNVATNQLRADVGCIVDSEHLDEWEALRTNFEVTTFPIDEYLVAEFPYKGKLSVLIGIFKVYPEIETYIEENDYQSDTPVMEIWDIPNKKIIYRKKLVKNS